VLQQLRGLINEEGLLVILDAIKEPYYLLTSIEFNDGLSDFDDFRNEDDSTFFERKQWEYMFGQVGLDIVAAYPEEGEAFFGLGQGIFVLGVQNHHMEINTKELRAYLKQQLEEYELPNEIKIVPFLNNGKLMNKLPKTKEKTVSVEQPKTELEMQLEEIWGEVLNKESIGRHENFFAIGGDSLLLSQIIAKMWDSLPETKAWSWGDLMREILETPTIAEMADKIETKEKSHEAITTLIEGTSESRIVYVIFHAGTGSLVPYLDMIKILREREYREEEEWLTGELEDEYGLIPEIRLLAENADYGRVRLQGTKPCVVLDFCDNEKVYGGGLAAGSIWLDFPASEEKERRVASGCPQIRYFSMKKEWKDPRKALEYLDTISKNGYNNSVD
jgi:pyochelin synthetase